MSDTPVYDQTERGEYTLDKISVSPDEVTPNVKIENPDTRRKLTTIVGAVGAVLGTVLVVDLASTAFDLSAWTEPFTAGFLYLASYYGIAVTLPNTPKRH